MRLLQRTLQSIIKKRGFAQVHDVRIERVEIPKGKETGSMERNVFQKPLQIHSTKPLTGFNRTGYCEVPPSDQGNHSIAGIVTDEFLDFSAKQGNDLRSIGLTGGCKWCLCVNRWKEAFKARSGDDDPKVPKIYLSRTNEKALQGATMEELRKFAVDKEGNGSS